MSISSFASLLKSNLIKKKNTYRIRETAEDRYNVDYRKMDLGYLLELRHLGQDVRSKVILMFIRVYHTTSSGYRTQFRRNRDNTLIK